MSTQSEATTYEGKLIIGLTGNIATGKSAVTRMAADQGALIIDADKVVHELMNQDSTMQAAIAVAFGSEVRREDGRIDRQALGKIVFDDPAALQDLEAMVHPAVRKVVDQRILDSDESIILIEAIKLLEGDLASICHQVWVTRCEPQRQLERLRVCRGMETNEAKTRIKAQPPQEEKVARADIVIDTNGLMKDTALQFKMAWGRLPDPATVEASPRLPLPDEDEPPLPGTGLLSANKELEQTAVPEKKAAPSKTAAPPPDLPASDVPEEDIQVRRARPSDIPSILLLIQRATDGEVKMKRSELLMALSERGYFIGQVGAEVSTVMGYHMDSQIARIDQIYIYPLEMAMATGTAVLKEIETSAFNHMGQIIIAFLDANMPEIVRQIFAAHGYETVPKEELARSWQLAIDESQSEDADFVVKIMNDIRKI